MAKTEPVKDTLSVEEYREDPNRALECASEVGRVSVVNNDGQEVFAIDWQNPKLEEATD